MTPTEDSRYSEVIPKVSLTATLTVPADANKQYSIHYVSGKGDAVGEFRIKIGSTIVWYGHHAADCSDGQNFGEKGIKNGIAKNEAITVEYHDSVPTTYKLNIGIKEITQV